MKTTSFVIITLISQPYETRDDTGANVLVEFRLTQSPLGGVSYNPTVSMRTGLYNRFNCPRHIVLASLSDKTQY